LEEVAIGTASPQATVERGTETIKSVVAKAGESGIHDRRARCSVQFDRYDLAMT
jgi:hypothetical protein